MRIASAILGAAEFEAEPEEEKLSVHSDDPIRGFNTVPGKKIMAKAE